MRRNSFHILGLAFWLCAAPAAAVTAGRPAPEAAPGPSAAATRLAGAARAAAFERQPSWTRFRARYGEWNALWNEETGAPHRAFGRGIPLAGFAPERGAVDAALRTFVAAHPDLFGPAAGLETAAILEAGGRWYARYRPSHGGIPALFADLEFRVGADGRLFAFGAGLPAIPPGTRTTPGIGAGAARDAATQGLPFVAGRDAVRDGPGLCFVPLAARDGVEYRLAYDVRVDVASPPGRWIVLVDAADGAILWRVNRVRHDVAGTVTGEVHTQLPTDPLEPRAFPNLRVADGFNVAVTDAAGAYALPPAGPVTVTAQLAGPWVNVNRQDGADAAFASAAASPATVPIDWTDANSHVAERDAFFHANVAHDHAKSVDPGFTGNDYSMPCAVNIADVCNAYWDGTGIHFYLAGGGCPNTATLADVVYHEYGHGVNDNQYIQAGAPFGMANGALHEGLADVNAALIRDNPVIGDGFFGPGTMIRTIDNTRRWPQDAAGDGHVTGLIVAGAVWDLREAIGLPATTALAHFARYGTPDDADAGVAMTEYFIEMLVADDDDSDLSNGTPNGAAIVAAFNAHGIGTGYFTAIAHAPLGDQPAALPYAVTATVTHASPFGLAALDPAAVRLHYTVNGGPEQIVAMAAGGGPDEFAAAIPAQAAALVRYWISAGDTEGGVQFDPPDAPAASHLFVAGATTTVLDQPMEADPGFTIGAPGDDATSGLWEFGDPVGTYGVGAPVQPEDDHSDPGVNCYFTGNASPGAGAGLNDVDGGRTTLTTGPFDATAGGAVKPLIEYWRWYSNDLGGSPGNDFWRVHISNDGGATWAVVESTTVSTEGWERMVFFVDDFVAPSADMRLRFIAADEGAGSLVEAAVDDLRVLDFSGLADVRAAAAPALALAAASPNPFGALTRLSFTLPRDGAAAVRVYDVGGRLVRTLATGRRAAGTHTLSWDGADENGGIAPSGVYFVRLSTDAGERVRALVRTR